MKENRMSDLYQRITRLVKDEIDPEEIRKLLDEEFKKLAEEIGKNEG